MNGKRNLWPILVLGLLLMAAPALAQTQAPAAAPAGAIPPEMIKALEAEKPLTQADVETFARILPSFAEAGRKDPATAIKIVTDAGFSEPRMALLYSRVSFALMMGEMPNLDEALKSQGIPKVLWPTASDLALVKKNRAALEKAYQASMDAAATSVAP